MGLILLVARVLLALVFAVAGRAKLAGRAGLWRAGHVRVGVCRLSSGAGQVML